MPPNSFSDLFAALTEMMTRNASMFEATGNVMFRAFAIVIICWFGIQWALKGGMPLDRFASMIVTISFGLAMTRYYSQPIPGIGVSFYHLIVDEGTKLANQLNGSTVTDIMSRLDRIYWGAETPGLSAVINTLEILRYGVLVLAIVAAEAAVFLVIAFGYIATAVCVLVGPIFIPFFIVPGLEWLFWGWVRALLQYAFYPVVANAYLYVFAQLLMKFSDQTAPPYDGAKIAVLFVPLLFLLIAFTWGLLKVPSLVNSLFTGKSGESAVPTSW
jgi:hypothetical protein